jgi:hypothetical protein
MGRGTRSFAGSLARAGRRCDVSMRVTHNTNLRGLQILSDRLRKGEFYVNVGVPAEAKEDDGTSAALVAAANEFGTTDGRIPERSFMRTGLGGGKEDQIRLNKVNLVRIAHGQTDMATALGQLGAMGAGQVKGAIRRSKSLFKPNAPSTIAHKTVNGKKGDQPLVDSGNLQQSITWVVPPEFGGGGHA